MVLKGVKWYIYHGWRTGPLEKPSQVIYSEDLVWTTVPKTIGFSLSGGVDMDDMAVGAYDSNSVIVFKSCPVAIIDAYQHNSIRLQS